MIDVVVDDIAFAEADAIVRPATALLEPTTPELRRIEQVGGAPFWEQIRVQDELGVGSAVVTGGGDLAVEFVIHAIIRSAREPVSAHTVRRALVSAMQRANDWQLAHLAVPPLGTGAGNLSLEASAEAMRAAFDETLGRTSFPRQVTLVVGSPDEQHVFAAQVARPPG